MYLLIILISCKISIRTIRADLFIGHSSFIPYVTCKQLGGCFWKNAEHAYRCTWSMLQVFNGVRVSRLNFVSLYVLFWLFHVCCVYLFSLSVCVVFILGINSFDFHSNLGSILSYSFMVRLLRSTVYCTVFYDCCTLLTICARSCLKLKYV